MDGRNVRVDAGPVLSRLRARARAIAEEAYERRGGGDGGDIRKRARNRSAYVSRHSARHYERLLAEHLQRVEDERDEQATAYQIEAEAVAELRSTANRLAKLLTQHEQVRQHERNYKREHEVEE